MKLFAAMAAGAMFSAAFGSERFGWGFALVAAVMIIVYHQL